MIIKMVSLGTVEDNCIGCKFCETNCLAGAIKVSKGKASIDETKCVSCMRCFSICPNEALSFEPLPEPVVLQLDISQVDADAIEELCARADLDPERSICTCTLSLAKEAAAAVLMGARTLKEITSMTGIRGVCGMWCTDPLIRLLEAHGVHANEYVNDGVLNAKIRLKDITDEVAEKYPEYRIKEDKLILKEKDIPYLPEML
jgi:NAD-dependent dihydropyrimidine dehydrogenase PreA subunit/bacterioferritin-associated ferredoxin